MDKNEERLDPLAQLRNQIAHKQPSEKPADDVANFAGSEPGAESHFVQSTREELNKEESEKGSPSAEGSSAHPDRHMPDTERVTEKD